MWQTLLRGVIAGVLVIAVAELSKRNPRLGAFLLTLPLVSILAFIAAWYSGHDMTKISRLARETLVLVPLGLPFFIPIGFAHRLHLSFWPAFLAGFALASLTVGLWLWLGPEIL
jgi:hypothetical protein